MIYKIRVVSDEVDDFRRDIEIDSEATFQDLKDIICETTGFDTNVMSSFFVCDDSWGSNVEITLEDMGHDMTRDIYLMKDTRLSEFIEDVGQKLLYTFDYLGDRSLFLQVKDEEFGRELESPVVVLAKGEAPRQTIDIEEIDAKTQAKINTTDIFEGDDDFLNDDNYDEDEISDFEEMNY